MMPRLPVEEKTMMGRAGSISASSLGSRLSTRKSIFRVALGGHAPLFRGPHLLFGKSRPEKRPTVSGGIVNCAHSFRILRVNWTSSARLRAACKRGRAIGLFTVLTPLPARCWFEGIAWEVKTETLI